jgi:hypothetical protein
MQGKKETLKKGKKSAKKVRRNCTLVFNSAMNSSLAAVDWAAPRSDKEEI